MKQILRMGQLFVLVLIFFLVMIALKKFNYWPYNKKDDFNIDIVLSDIDYDHDGIDDYTDILNGAKGFISIKPKYKSAYYAGGYPDDGNYVCTDIIWYALNKAGYDFKSMIDEDILNNQEDYDIDVIDSNIDFRRVNNIRIFLDKYTQVLTNNVKRYEEFQPGDIIIYKKNHIAIVSDKRNEDKIPYILHHDGTYNYEEDNLQWGEIEGHYRFKINDKTIIKSVS